MKIIRKGSTGTDTAICQAVLNALWCTDADGKFLKTDGVCGTKTVAAIIEFQTTAKNNGLYDDVIDGEFGPKCWNIVGYE